MATKTDVLIIGGGSIGLNVAYSLQKAGRNVTLLDREQIGIGSSSGNAGHIVPSHIVPLAAPGVIPTAIRWLLDPSRSPFGLKISFSPDYLSWLVRFAASCSEGNVESAIPALKALGILSATRFPEIIASERLECAYRAKGLLFLYQTEKEFASGRREAELLRRHDMPAEILDRSSLIQREPMVMDSVIGGVDFRGDASLDPGAFLAGMKTLVAAQGAILHEQSAVTDLVVEKGTITRVLTATEEFTPAQVVLAAGAWSPKLASRLGLKIPIQPARGYSLTVRAPRSMPQSALLLGERKIAITPMGEKLRLTGRLELGEMSTIPDPRWLRRIESSTREYIQLDSPLEGKETWSGLRPTTPDGLPIIGFSPRQNNLILATGHAMLGLSLGPGTGQVVAELANGERPEIDLHPFRAERFQKK